MHPILLGDLSASKQRSYALPQMHRMVAAAARVFCLLIVVVIKALDPVYVAVTVAEFAKDRAKAVGRRRVCSVVKRCHGLVSALVLINVSICAAQSEPRREDFQTYRQRSDTTSTWQSGVWAQPDL